MPKILDKDSVFLKNDAGIGDDPDTGLKYELMTSFVDHSPIVKSKKSGRTFHLSWSDLVNAAVEAGVDKEPEEMN